MKLSRILVPTDLSAASLAALDYAAELGRPFAAEIVLFFVVEPIVYATPTDLYGASADLGTVLQEQERSGMAQLRKLQARYAKKVRKLRAIQQTGTPYVAITNAAKKLKANLIVMSTHGRTGLSHLFLGSVAERVVRTAPCPVLTVRAGSKPARRAARRRRA
jgi:nucleotide-binding universal stress UspA family protein